MAERRSERDEPFGRLSVGEAAELISRGDAQVVDLRWRDDYCEGHIPGAVPIPLYELFERRDELQADRDIVLVCEVGLKSALGAEIAASLGRSRVFNLEGGLKAWVESGRPLEEC